MASPFVYPNWPTNPNDIPQAWNTLVQILNRRDNGTFYGAANRDPFILSGTVPQQRNLDLVSANYTLTATTNILARLLQDLATKGIINGKDS